MLHGKKEGIIMNQNRFCGKWMYLCILCFIITLICLSCGTYNPSSEGGSSSTGAVTTLAGTAGTIGSSDGTGGAASFNFPVGITTDGTNLYVADTYNDTIRKIVI